MPALLGLSNAVTLDSLFNTKTTGGGSCGPKKAVVQAWLDDTVLLVDAALAGITAVESDPNMRNNLAAYFGIRSTRAGKPFANDSGKLSTVKSKWSFS